MNALGIIFSEHYNQQNTANELTRFRAPAGLPFAGRYRTIDFTLSAMVNAHIKNIGIIASQNYGSMIDHLGNGEDWDLNRRRGGLMMLTPMAWPGADKASYRGRLDALRAFRTFIEESKAELVVLAYGGTVASVDLEAMAKEHQRNGAYLTVAYSEIPGNVGEAILETADDGRITKLSYQLNEEEAAKPYSLGLFMMRREDLVNFLLEAENNDYTNMNRDLIQHHLEDQLIYGYRHPGYARIIQNTADYFKASMDMLEPAKKAELFPEERPVYTKVKDSVPTHYDYNADVENSLIADGCTIRGTVKNSVIFRGVTVEEGAVVENAILMQKSIVEGDAKIDCGILDKNSRISSGTVLKGSAQLPFVVGKNKTV